MNDDSAIDVAAANRTFVALLAAHVHGTPLDTAPMISELRPIDLVYLLGITLGMLAHEVRLGCADSNIPIDEYLTMLGISVA